MAMVDIVIEADGWAELPGIEALAIRAVTAALAAAERHSGGVKTMPDAELVLLFTDDAAIRDLNSRFRGKANATNVLSFPAVELAKLGKSPMIGDLALAYETCAREAATEAKSLSAHVTHLIVHGTLHLVGFDHETDSDADKMEALERAVLADLDIADPYADRQGGTA